MKQKTVMENWGEHRGCSRKQHLQWRMFLNQKWLEEKKRQKKSAGDEQGRKWDGA